MAQLAKFKPVFMALAGILILWAIYTFGGNLDLSGGAGQHAADIEARTQQIESTILAELDRLQKVELDGRLFESDGFRSLKDWSVPLGEPDVGRPDPFARFGTQQ